MCQEYFDESSAAREPWFVQIPLWLTLPIPTDARHRAAPPEYRHQSPGMGTRYLYPPFKLPTEKSPVPTIGPATESALAAFCDRLVFAFLE